MTPDSELAPTASASAPGGGLRPRMVLILIAVALLAGVALAWLAITRWDGLAAWTGRAQPQPVAQAGGDPAIQPAPAIGAPTEVVGVQDDSFSLAEAAAREAQLSGQIATLEARLANVELRAQAASGNAARAEGLLVAFAARRAVDRGLALGYIEAQLRDRFAPTQPRAVAVVIQASRNPVTLGALRIGLDELAPELTTATADANWWHSVRQELSTLVVLRRTGSASPRPTDRLSRARRALEAGQVDAALAEVARLPGRDKARAWMTAARRYLQARQALDVLETAAIVEPQRAAAMVPATSAPARLDSFPATAPVN